MTSTVSSNKKTVKKDKNNFLSLLLWTLKSHKLIFIIYFSVMIMIMFFGMLFVENAIQFKTTEQFYGVLNSAVREVISELIPLISSVFTIIIGTNIFKIYHNKRMMDMYGSLPIKKITMFLSRYLSGALVIIVTLLISGLLCGVSPIFMLNHIDYFDTSFFILVMKNFLLITISSIASFSMFTFISMICGSSLYTIVMFLAINIIYPIVASSVVDDVSSVIPGFYFILYDKLPFMAYMILSPILSTFLNIDSQGYFTVLDDDISHFTFNIPFYVTYWILFIIVFLVASILISKIRKNENIQSVFIFSFVKYIFMIPLTICLGYIAGTIIKSGLHLINEQDMGLYFVLGSIIGIIIAYVVLFIVFNKGVKGIAKTLPALGVSLCIFFAYYIFIATGLFGVDMYVPNEDDVVSVCVSESLLTEGTNESLKEMGEDRYTSQYYNWYIDSDTKEVKVLDGYITDKDFIKDTIKIHKTIVDDLHNVNGNLYSFDRYNDFSYLYYYDSGYGYDQFVVSYKLKNGTTVNRYYLPGDFDYSKTSDLCKKLWGSKEIKKASTLLLRSSIDDITGFSLISNDSSYSQEFTLDINNRKYEAINKEFLEKLIPTLKEEIEQDNHFYTLPVDDYQIQINYDNEIANDIYSIWNYDTYGVQSLRSGITEESITIPKENYPKTWEIIEEYSNSSKLFQNETEKE